MKNLSVFLQKENCDLSHCVNYANNVYEEIHDILQNAEEKFKSIFVKALEIAGTVDVRLVFPRYVKRQQNRDNYEGDPETYYRRSSFILFLDHLLDQLKSRFLDHRELLSKIQNILPTKCSELTTEEIVLTVKTFRKEWSNDIKGSDEDLESDITMWRR